MEVIMNSRLVTLTDTTGTLVIPEEEVFEPEPGSIALACGLHGTAWQRLFSDGLWHSTRSRTEKPRTWGELLTKRNLFLVYDAPRREE